MLRDPRRQNFSIFDKIVLIGRSGDTAARIIVCAFNTLLMGSAGKNLLNAGSAGRDTIGGGTGFDTVSFAARTSNVSVNLTTGTEANSLSTFTGIEAALGSGFDDNLIGDGDANWLGGGAGDDVILGGAGDDTINGGAGDDDLDGGTGTDFVSYVTAAAGIVVNLASGQATGAGNDTLAGFEGVIGSGFSDLLTGGAGNNVLNVGFAGQDTVFGGSGFDTVSFALRTSAVSASLASGQETTSGSSLNDVEAIVGTLFGDSLTGNGSANFLSGLLGNDAIQARGGSDTVNGGGGDDDLDGGTGFDFASFAGAMGGVVANLGTQSATGWGNDTLVGFDALIGSAFDDVLTGDAADNTLNGGGGADTLTGAGGADNFRFTAGDANGDSVTDFSGTGGDGDRLTFAGYGVGATFTNVGGDQWQVANAGLTIVDVITVVGTVGAGDFAFA